MLELAVNDWTWPPSPHKKKKIKKIKEWKRKKEKKYEVSKGKIRRREIERKKNALLQAKDMRMMNSCLRYFSNLATKKKTHNKIIPNKITQIMVYYPLFSLIICVTLFIYIVVYLFIYLFPLCSLKSFLMRGQWRRNCCCASPPLMNSCSNCF